MALRLPKKFKITPVQIVIASIIILFAASVLFLGKQKTQKPVASTTPVGTYDFTIESKDYIVTIKDKEALIKTIKEELRTYDLIKNNSIIIIITRTGSNPSVKNSVVVVDKTEKTGGPYTLEFFVPYYLFEKDPMGNILLTKEQSGIILQSILFPKLVSSQKGGGEAFNQKLLSKQTYFFTVELKK